MVIWLITFIKSFIIGICAILPGVSGSVVAVSLGIYDKMISIINNKEYKNNKLFLVLTIIGVSLGIFITGNILFIIFNYETIIYYILIGIILSEVPFLIKRIHNKGKINYYGLLVAFIISLLLDILTKSNNASEYSFFKYFLGGLFFSFGKIFPGVSSSFFLLCLGIYDDIIVLVTKPLLLFINIKLYIPFLIGTIIGIIIFIKLLTYLVNNKYELVYSIILGLIISSIIILFPGFSLDLKNILGIILMIVFFIVFINIKKKKDK